MDFFDFGRIITLDFFDFWQIITLDNFIFWHKTLKNMFICFIAICDERIEKGISFRMIQAYEQGGQDITKAEERRVFALARTLGVWGGGDLRVM